MSIKKILSISLAIILIFSLDFYVNKKRPIKTIVFIVLMSLEKEDVLMSLEKEDVLVSLEKEDVPIPLNYLGREALIVKQYGGPSILGTWEKPSAEKELSLEEPILINYSGFDPEDFNNYFQNEINKKLSINPSKKLQYKSNPTQKYSKLLSSHFHLLLMFDRHLTNKEISILQTINQVYIKNNNFHHSIHLKLIISND